MANIDREVQYRHIITKAVCGRGRKFSQATHTISPPDNISSILGAWIMNHSYKASRAGDQVEVVGSYDVNLWYSCGGNTKTDVIKETVRYVEPVPLSYLDRNLREETMEVSVMGTQPPHCIEATLSGNTVLVRVEKEHAVEITGETKICVAVYPDSYNDMDDKEFGVAGEEENPGDFEDLDPELVIDDLDD